MLPRALEVMKDLAARHGIVRIRINLGQAQRIRGWGRGIGRGRCRGQRGTASTVRDRYSTVGGLRTTTLAW